GRERSEHHERPPALAIADDEGLVVVARMKLAELAHERDLGRAYRLDRLPRQRVREEGDEVAGMTELECDADLTVHLEAADPGAVAGARVDVHEGTHLRIGRRMSLGRLDAHQRIVRRLLQVAAVD